MAEQTERDWEAMSRARLERLVAGLVQRIHDTADEIEREARHQIDNASSAERLLEFQTYPRVVGLIANKLGALGFNLHVDNLIDAAADAELAWREKQDAGLIEAAHAVADENRDGDTPESGAVRQLVREADSYKKTRT